MNKYKFLKMLFLSINLTLVGCASLNDSVSRNEFFRLQDEVSQLKNQVSNQAAIMGDLNERTNALQRSQNTSTLSAVKSPYNSAPYYPPMEHNVSFNASSSEKNHYDHAYGLYQSGAYDRAISEFQSIIRTYPNGEYADNAQYWIGVVLLKKGDEASARQAFERVIQNYPRGNKAQDAETKLRALQKNQYRF